jgi:glycosyltransferase involved in cell wall biosynthesis
VSRPRILVVGPLPPPLGGVGVMNDLLAHSSLARDFDLHTLDTSKKRVRAAADTATWRSPVFFARNVWAMVVMLVRIRPAAVYVHATSGYAFLRDWVVMMKARALGARVVCHYHGTHQSAFPYADTPLGRWRSRVMMRAAHRVIVLGETYRAHLAQVWRRDDIAVMPNLVNASLYRVPAVRPTWLPPDERAVLFVGRLSRPKGVWDLLEAIPSVLAAQPRTRFVFVGVADSAADESALRAQAAALGVADHVTFLGAIDGAPKVQAYLASSVFVLPSWIEGFPLVIPEAMAAGLPLVVTRVGVVSDYVHDGEDGHVVEPHDPASLARAIVALLSDAARCARIADRLRRRAVEEFDVEVGAAIARDVLRSVLA